MSESVTTPIITMSYPVVDNIIWAKIPGFPYWPVQVVPYDQPTPNIRKQLYANRTSEEDIILVRFIEKGPKTLYHLVSIEDVAAWSKGVDEGYVTTRTKASIELAKQIESFETLCSDDWVNAENAAPVVPEGFAGKGSKRKVKGSNGSGGSKRRNVNDLELWFNYKEALGQSIKSTSQQSIIDVLDKMLTVDPNTEVLRETNLGQVLELLARHERSSTRVRAKSEVVLLHFKRSIAEEHSKLSAVDSAQSIALAIAKRALDDEAVDEQVHEAGDAPVHEADDEPVELDSKRAKSE